MEILVFKSFCVGDLEIFVFSILVLDLLNISIKLNDNKTTPDP